MLDKNQLLKSLLKNPRILEKITQLKPSKEHLLEALPILIDMNEEIDDNSRETLTSFIITSDGLRRIVILSSKGKRLLYLKNIVTQSINHIDFEEEKSFEKTEDRIYIADQFRKIFNDPQNNKGFYIYGEMGIGKTFFAKRIVKKIAEGNKKVGFVNTANLISTVKSSFSQETKYEYILEMLKKVEFLFIDDIGSEKIAPWFRDDFLFTILNERMEKKRPTFFTSNFSIDELEKKQSQTSGSKYWEKDKSKRLISRIKSLSKEIHLQGKNRRY